MSDEIAIFEADNESFVPSAKLTLSANRRDQVGEYMFRIMEYNELDWMNFYKVRVFLTVIDFCLEA